MSELKIKKKAFIPGYILVIAISIIVLIVANNSSGGKNPLIKSGFLVIVLFSTLSILRDGRVLSVNKVIWYFCLIFMAIAPLCQYVSGYYPWRFIVTEDELGRAQLLTILFYFIYFVSYNFIGTKVRIKHKKKGQESALTNYLCRPREFGFGTQIALFICVLVCFALLVRLTGFTNLFIKAENTVEIENSTVRFVVKKFLSAFPAMACTIFIFDKKRSVSKIAVIITLIITLLSNFPTSTTRYWMATILMGLGLARFMKRRESRKLDYAILIAVIVLFPFFYIFKTRTLSELLGGAGYSYSGIINSFNTVDFDAFTLLARAGKYVADNGITWGKQLLNIILFFVPRSLWPGKPITTNTLIASSQGARYTNLSCPLPAEGYVNFGAVGVILYAIIIAAYASYLDKLYWGTSKEERNNIITMIYPYLAIIMLYMSRGPLQPSFIQTVALILPMIVIVGVFPNKTARRMVEGGTRIPN